MSIGLAFVQGLVGGFQKNIEREQTSRTTQDQRLASLQDTLFAATAKAAAEGNPVPASLGMKLKQAKIDLDQSRKDNPIGLFGTGKADPLNLDITEIAGTMNDVGGSYFELGNLKIPMGPLYAKEKDPFRRSYLFLTEIDKYAAKPEQLKRMKKELENESVAKYFNGVLRTNRGLYKALLGPMVTPKGATKITGIPQVGTPQGQFTTLGEFDYLKDVDLDDTEQDIEVAKDRLFGKKDTGMFAQNRKKNVLFPYLTSEKETQYIAFELEPSDMESIKRIAILNGEKDPSVFISKYRKSIGKISPTAETTEDRLKIEFEIKKFFPSIFHAIELEKRGASLPLVNMTKQNRESIIKYLDDNIGYNIGDRVRALAPLMKLEKNQKLSLVGGIEGFDFKQDVDKDEFFLKSVGIKISDFNKQYESSRDTVKQLKTLMNVESSIISTPNGLVRFLQQTFGSIVAETGVIDQVSNILSGGQKDDDVNEETLMEIVKRVKDERGIESQLTAMSKSESIMIALAANMARAVDPAGRLSNQDFEVQLRRLGASGFFRAKISQITQLGDVFDDFNGRLERIEMIKRVVDGATTRNFNQRDFKILNANAVLNNLMKGEQAGKTLKSTISINYVDTWDSSTFIGPNGETVIIKEREDGTQDYFIGDKQVDQNQIMKKGQTPTQNNNQETEKKSLLPEKKQESTQNNLNQIAPETIKGTIIGGDAIRGIRLKGKEGLYLPTGDGTFYKKP